MVLQPPLQAWLQGTSLHARNVLGVVQFLQRNKVLGASIRRSLNSLPRSDTSAFIRRLLVTLVGPLTFFALTLAKTSGPAYASSDEGGYLAFARLFAGGTSPLGSAVFPGYSLILSPLYFLFNDPQSIWRGVLFLNFVFHILTLIGIHKLAKLWRPDFPEKRQDLVVACVSVLPIFSTMMGYAFPSLFITFLLTMQLVAVTKIAANPRRESLVVAAISGVLLAVHPTGVVPLICSLLLIALTRQSIRFRVLFFLFAFAIPFVVLQMVRPRLFSAIGSGSGDFSGGYNATGVAQSTLKNIANLSMLTNFLRELLSLSFATVVATGGLVGIVLALTCREIWKSRHLHESPALNGARLWLTWCLVGYLVLTARSFGHMEVGEYLTQRLEFFIFLRYLDPILVLVTAVGLIEIASGPSRQNWKWATLISGLLGLSGGLTLWWTINHAGWQHTTPDISDFQRVMSQSFWPASVLKQVNPAAWLILGLMPLIFYLLRQAKGVFLIVLAFGVVTVPAQLHFYSSFVARYGQPPPIGALISANYSESCIGWDTSISALPVGLSESGAGIIFGNLSFQLGALHFSGFDRESWQKSCDGPLITFAPRFESDLVLAYDSQSKLYLVDRTYRHVSMPKRNPYVLSIASSRSDACMRSACFGFAAEVMNSLPSAKPKEFKSSRDNRESGVLFRSPGEVLHRGFYLLMVQGQFVDLDGAEVLVSWDEGRSHTKFDLSAYKSREKLFIPFKLDTWVSDLSFTFSIGQESKIHLDGFKILSRKSISVVKLK